MRGFENENAGCGSRGVLLSFELVIPLLCEGRSELVAGVVTNPQYLSAAEHR